MTIGVLSAILNVLVQCQRNFFANMCGDNCNKYFRPWDSETDASETESPSSVSTKTVVETDCSRCTSERDNERSPSPIINADLPSTGNLDRLSNFVMNATHTPTLNSLPCSSRNSENSYHLERSNIDSNSSESGASHGSISPPSAFATLPASIPVGYWATMTNNSIITHDMMSHQQTLQNIDRAAKLLQEQDAARQMKKLRPKKFFCKYCNAGFCNNGQLTSHTRIHTGERPYKCGDKTCGKSFTRNEELTRHMKTHTGEKPYGCHYCPKRFGRRDHLKKHMRTHTLRAGPIRLEESALAFNIFGGQSGSLLPVMPPLSTLTPSAFPSTSTTMPLSPSMIPSTSMSTSLQVPFLPQPLFPPPPTPMIPSSSFWTRTVFVPSAYLPSLPITPSTSNGSTSESSLFPEFPEMTLPTEFSSLPNPDLSSLPEPSSSNPLLSSSSEELTIDH